MRTKNQYKYQSLASFNRKASSRFVYVLVFLLSALSQESCKKFVQVPPPTTQLVTASVFNNDASATAAQVNIYYQMVGNPTSFYIAENTGIQGDELKSFSTIAAQQQLYTNALLATTTNVSNVGQWKIWYSLIYQANAVISGLQQNTGTSATVKQQLTGEAYLVRAFCHFYLTNLYGDVPLVLTTSYTINDGIARTPRLQVLQQVIADLSTAKNMLNSNYVDATDTAITTERVRPTKAVAAALLARAYLYLGDYSNKNTVDYQKAELQADSVIANNLYALSPLGGVFLANNSEAIWQLQTPEPPPSADTDDGQDFILTGAPSTGFFRSTTISTQLMNAFESGDQRQSNWIGSVSKGTSTYYFPNKYKNRTYVGTEYTMVLRLGEQYLIRAEARAEQNNIGGALADLNTIRNRAGLPNYAGAQDQASVLTAILHERQVELFTEWGNRWFDLNRAVNTNPTVNINTVMGSPGENVCGAKGGIWNPDDRLYPIPQVDRNLDPNLTQNPGY